MDDFPETTIDDWRERVQAELAGAGLDTLTTETLEGLVLAPLYAASEHRPGLPGVPPYVRGRTAIPAQPPWRRWQLVDIPDLAAAAEWVEADRAGGVDGIWLRLDRATRLGRSPVDAPELAGEGVVALDAVDLERLCRAAGDGKLALRLDAGGNTLPASAALFTALERVGREGDSMRVHLAHDPLGALVTDGLLPASLERLAGESALLAARAAHSLPGVRALGVSTAPYARAGADAAQQLALAMATAVEYLRWLEQHGIDPEIGAAQIDFVFETDRHFLLEVAKLRAARRLWSHVQEACGVTPAPPWIHACTGWRTLTRLDPWTNVLRGTVQAVAAVVGGADALTTLPYDTRLGRPTRAAARLARNTQAILAEESGLGRPLDVAGGSYAVETLTGQLAASAWERFQAIEAAGGMTTCLQTGQVYDTVAESARRRATRMREGKLPVLGVTDYPVDVEASARPAEEPGLAAATARERLTDRRGGTEGPDLAPLEAAAYDSEDPARLGEALMKAARSGATIAEMTAALRPGAVPFEQVALAARADEELVEPREERTGAQTVAT